MTASPSAASPLTTRALTIVVGALEHDRLHAALSVAAASAALGRGVTVHLHGEAVRLAAPGLSWSEDARFAASGLPTIAELIASLFDLGATVTACQSGLALTGLSAEDIDPRIAPGGLVDCLGRAGDAELLLA